MQILDLLSRVLYLCAITPGRATTDADLHELCDWHSGSSTTRNGCLTPRCPVARPWSGYLSIFSAWRASGSRLVAKRAWIGSQLLLQAGRAMLQEDREGRKRYGAGFQHCLKLLIQEGRHGSPYLNQHFPTRGCTRQCQKYCNMVSLDEYI